jgi:hypothetical protein
VKVNLEPVLSRLRTQIRPPYSSRKFSDRVRPSSVTSTFLAAVPICPNSWKMADLRQRPDACVRNRDVDVAVDRTARRSIRPPLGVDLMEQAVRRPGDDEEQSSQPFIRA